MGNEMVSEGQGELLFVAEALGGWARFDGLDQICVHANGKPDRFVLSGFVLRMREITDPKNYAFARHRIQFAILKKSCAHADEGLQQVRSMRQHSEDIERRKLLQLQMLLLV